MLLSKIISIIILLITLGSCELNHDESFDRVVGGYTADIADFKYQASIRYMNKHRCGGEF